MGYIPGFTYDIFISYAHVDNETVDKQLGWIEQFYKNLNLLLAKRTGRMDTIKIWWDTKKLDGSRLFGKSIEEGIQNSAIMISLVSPGYLASQYCINELDLFYKKAQKESIGLHIGDQSRIFNVLLNNIPNKQWPDELTGTTGFPFHDASETNQLGDPIDINHPDFNRKMKELRDSIIALCESFPKVTPITSDGDYPKENTDKKEFSIYFGEVADSLRSVRKRTISELEKKGYNVVYGIPPPDEAGAHEKKVKEELQKSMLAVHLLDQYPGRDIKGAEDMWYPQKQTELALQYAQSKIIWVPAELEVETVEEQNYKAFLQQLKQGENTEYIKGNKSTISQEITDIAEEIKARIKIYEKGKLAVLLDTHFTDQVYAMDVGKALLENQIQPFINPQEDDPRKNLNLLTERISQVSKLIFFYGKVSRDWVVERMKAVLQEIISHDYPIEDFFIYLVPPHKDPDDIFLKQKFLKVSVIDNSNTFHVDKTVLQHFLKNLKGEPE